MEIRIIAAAMSFCYFGLIITENWKVFFGGIVLLGFGLISVSIKKALEK